MTSMQRKIHGGIALIDLKFSIHYDNEERECLAKYLCFIECT